MFLSVKNIHKSYGNGDSRVEVLKGIDLEIEKGNFCVLLGPSGSGKSTLLNILGGIDSADEGTIQISHHVLENMSEKELTLYRREHLGFIFQMYNLIPDLTVRENIEVGSWLGNDPLDADEIIETLGLTAHQDKLPSQLSGGQQQRTSIGRALIKRPDILLCDEPTGALDYNTSRDILRLIGRVSEQYRTTILMVTHNEAISAMADQIVKLKDGRVRRSWMNENKVSADEIEW